MSKSAKGLSSLHISPELSWLSFNRRVLQQTKRTDFPVFERLRYISIWSSNTDEFFAARVSRAFLEERGSDHYRAIMTEANSQAEEAVKIYLEFQKTLTEMGYQILETAQLTLAEKQYFGAYLAEVVAPLTDLIRPESLPELNSNALYFAAGEGLLQHLIRLPESLPRILQVPGRDGSFIRLGALLRMRSDLFLPERTKSSLFEFRMIRLAQITQSRTDWNELPEALESRMDGVVSHLELEEDFPKLWGETIRVGLGLHPEEVFHLPPPLDLSLVDAIVKAGTATQKFSPLVSKRPKGFKTNPFARLASKDVVLFHPFEDYDLVESFAHSAATDPKVDKIRSTLYRIGEVNGIADALILAAKNGKDVAVLLEGRARFDELANLEWSLKLQGAGVRVLPLPDKKVHAKAFYVKRGHEEFVHLGTGNYNPVNGRLYTDFSLFTSNKLLTSDVRNFFAGLEHSEMPNLTTARTASSIRDLFLEKIKMESHKKGHIILKFNHITDAPILDALEVALQSGCRIDLIARTTLTRIWSTAHTKSLIGRHLEHARVAAFGNKGKWEVWMGSADLMRRNLDRRYELFFPVLDSRTKNKVLKILNTQIADNQNTYLLTEKGQSPVWGGKINGQSFE